MFPNAVENPPAAAPKRWSVRGLAADLVWLPPAALLLYVILRYVINFPTIDLWDSDILFFQKIDTYGFRVSDLISQLSDHRVAMSRVVALIAAKTMSYNPRFEAAVTWGLICLTAVNVCVLSRRTLPGRWRWVAVLLAGTLLFSLTPYGNLINPSGLAYYFASLFCTAVLVIDGSRLSPAAKFAAGAAIATVATFSCALGMALWLATLPALVLPVAPGEGRQALRRAGAWLATAAAVIPFYFIGYKPNAPVSIRGILQEPLVFGRFYLTTLGSPYAYATDAAPLAMGFAAGTALALLFAALVAYCLVRRADAGLLRRAVPWICLGLYVLISAGAISLGRVSMGPESALLSQYTNITILLSLALVFLVPIVVEHAVASASAPASVPASAPAARPAARWIAFAIYALLAGSGGYLHARSSISVLNSGWPHYWSFMNAAKTATLYLRHFYEPNILAGLYVGKTIDVMRPRAEFADARGYLTPRLLDSARVADVLGSDRDGLGAAGSFGAMEAGGEIGRGYAGVSGWAVFPGRRRPADAVVLSYEQPGGEATVFAVATVGIHRPEVAAKLGGGDYLRCGWEKAFNPSRLPRGKVVVRAWAFDARRARAYALNGALTLEVK